MIYWDYNKAEYFNIEKYIQMNMDIMERLKNMDENLRSFVLVTLEGCDYDILEL